MRRETAPPALRVTYRLAQTVFGTESSDTAGRCDTLVHASTKPGGSFVSGASMIDLNFGHKFNRRSHSRRIPLTLELVHSSSAVRQTLSC